MNINQPSLARNSISVHDADIIGRNSGSPAVNQARASSSGIVFDGGIQSLVLDGVFDDKQARLQASVDSAATLFSRRCARFTMPVRLPMS